MLLMEAAFSNAFLVAKKRVVFDVVHVCHTKTCMLPYTLGAVTCRVKATCSNSVSKKGALFKTFVCSNCTSIYHTIFDSFALSLPNQAARHVDWRRKQ